MKRLPYVIMFVVMIMQAQVVAWAQDYLNETQEQRDGRMEWWSNARFGLFIHWGLYSIPAGEWNGTTNHAEWIRTTAQIPLKEYDKFVNQFDPVQFDADAWVKMAKDAGMKYIVITSKHHDGFCLFDSKYTDFDVMSTPYKRDILKAMAEACRKEGMKLCFYYSIMDWHHPDYLPRRDWEKDRPVDGANFDRYVEYVKNQLKELLTNYGDIGVLWFDGEWESTWNPERGRDLYEYVRKLQPSIIINNRVGAGRSGMEGMTKEGEFAGDFGTPEQEIPATGLPGVHWESCMTMNDHWGYNKHDDNWKSTKTLIRDLADIASKGGNFLLNIGPTAQGVFPPPSVERLKDISAWMKVNGESIYGTSASSFVSLPWGRCTEKSIEGGTRLYLHVFEWPSQGVLSIPDILNQPKKAFLLSDSKKSSLRISRKEVGLTIKVPRTAPDSLDAVIALDIVGNPDLYYPPSIASEFDSFVDPLEVTVSSDRDNIEVRYTLDGSKPTASSALARGRIRIVRTTEITAQCFRDGKPVSPVARKTFKRVSPLPAINVTNIDSGVAYSYFTGSWKTLPVFDQLKATRTGIVKNFDLAPRTEPNNFSFEYTGYVLVPRDGMYTFFTDSDDGSRLYVDTTLVVNNDGEHGMVERKGAIPLGKGLHALKVDYFQSAGDIGLRVSMKGPEMRQLAIPDSMLFHQR